MNLNEFLTGIGFFAKYPYTDFHELNLDWALAQIAKLRVEFDDFAHVNSLKYAGEWDITKSYSAFSVVDDQGFGYMALKPVPPGTQINDTEYWLMVVDYSQITQDYENRISALETTVGDASSGLVKDVDDLQTDMTNAQNDIGTLQNDVGTLQGTVGDASSGLVKDVDDLQTDMGNAQGDITALQGTVGDASSGLVKDVDDLQTDMSNAQGDITTLQNDVAALSARKMGLDSNSKIVCIGDSYGSLGTSWVDYINSYISPASMQNMCQSGGGLVGNAGTPGYYITQLQNATDKANITHIIIAGGFNDAYPSLNGSPIAKTQVLSSFTAIKNYIEANFPKASTYVAFLGYASDTGTSAANYIASQERAQCRIMRDYYVDACNKLNITYLHGVEYSLHSNTYFDDANVVYTTVFHPSSAGNEAMAINIIQAIRSGSCEVNLDATPTITAMTGIDLYGLTGNTTSAYVMKERFSNGVGQFEHAYGTVGMRIAGTFNLGVNHVQQIATISDAHVLFPDEFGRCRTTMACVVKYSDNTQTQCAAQLLIQGKAIYLILDDRSGKTISVVDAYPMLTVAQYDTI